jgi:hypothetical protein
MAKSKLSSDFAIPLRLRVLAVKNFHRRLRGANPDSIGGKESKAYLVKCFHAILFSQLPYLTQLFCGRWLYREFRKDHFNCVVDIRLLFLRRRVFIQCLCGSSLPHHFFG